FKINMDNTPLLNEIKQRRLDDGPARNQFMYGNVLVGLSLLLQDGEVDENGDDPKMAKVEDRIEMTCRALAPFMLALTSLGLEDLSEAEQLDGLEAATGCRPDSSGVAGRPRGCPESPRAGLSTTAGPARSATIARRACLGAAAGITRSSRSPP